MTDESDAVRYISSMDHGIIAFVGSGKQGKSCSLHSLIEICHPNRPKYILDSIIDDISIPGYTVARKPDDVPVGSIAVIEDVNRVFNSRGSSKDSTLQKWLGVISHKSNIVCITTQSMASTDLEFFRSQDCIIVHKRMFDEDIAFERPEFRANQMSANEWISRSVLRYPGTDPRAWCFFPRFNECISVPKVGWWSTANSHMLREVRICS